MPICIPSSYHLLPNSMDCIESPERSPSFVDDEQDLQPVVSPDPQLLLSPTSSKKRKSLHSHLEAISHKLHTTQPTIFRLTDPSSPWSGSTSVVSQDDDDTEIPPNKIRRILSGQSDEFMERSNSKRSAWGRPRGRRTIQDKIAEQEARAAELEQELRMVGLSRRDSPGDLEPSPTLARLGKPGTGRRGLVMPVESEPAHVDNRKTVPVSVIRRSPAVPSSATHSYNYSTVSESRSPSPISPEPQITVPQASLLNYMPTSMSLAEAAAYLPLSSNVVIVPSMVLQIPGLPTPGPIFIPQSSAASFSQLSRHFSHHSEDYEDQEPTVEAMSEYELEVRSQREERLSTKLKRIKAKSGQPAVDSPRGFLSQKIETLKRRESTLQQEFEEVINTPIARNGISSAQVLQRQMAVAEQQRDQAAQNALLFHMLRNPMQNADQLWRTTRRLQKE